MIDCQVQTYLSHKIILRTIENRLAYTNNMFVSKGCFNLYAVQYFTNKDIAWALEQPSQLDSRKFKSLFLYNVSEVVMLWDYLQRRQGKNIVFNRPEVLLWALYYLKVYPTWDQMALTTGITEKTLRKWIALVVNYISEIDDLVHTRQLHFPLSVTKLTITCYVVD
jgi:hypothetical protein